MRVLQLQERLTERLAELQRALASVKQLRGLLPICAYCNRIRSDENYWTKVQLARASDGSVRGGPR